MKNIALVLSFSVLGLNFTLTPIQAVNQIEQLKFEVQMLEEENQMLKIVLESKRLAQEAILNNFASDLKECQEEYGVSWYTDENNLFIESCALTTNIIE